MKVLFVCLGLLALSDRHDVFVHCVQCKAICRTQECIDDCYRIKFSECRSRGFGPGPRKTCDCT